MPILHPTVNQLLCLTAAALVHASAGAAASVPYMPGPAARHAIALLVDEAGLALTLSQWPLPAAAVQSALDALPDDLPPALDEARDRVQAELRQRQEAGLDLRLARRRSAMSGFGDPAVPGSSLALRGPVLQLGGQAVVQPGLRVEQAPVTGTVPAGTVSTSSAQWRLEGSAAVAEWGGIAAQAWSRRSWWGPGWQNSLILGDNAPALNGLGLQRATTGPSGSPWLSWLGPWNFELFIARQQGHAEPADAWLVGNRLTFRPWRDVEIGLTRTAQWGGQGRSQSLRSFLSMLSGEGTNAETAEQLAEDPGNQLAGFDLRLRCGRAWPCAGHLQLIGEDMAGSLPSRYMALYGLEAWSSDGRQRYLVEYVDSHSPGTPGDTPLPGYAYRNNRYPEGYAHERRWLGAGVGPDARIVTLGWLHAPTALSVRLHAGTLDGVGAAGSADWPGAVLPYVRGERARVKGLQWRREWRLGEGTLTPQWRWQRLRGDGWSRSSVQWGVEWRLEWDGASAGSGR